MDRPKELENLKQAADRAAGAGLMAGDANKAEMPTEIHPREILLRDLNDREQRLLDKLVLLREQRRILQCLDRHEAQMLVDVASIERRLSY